MDPGLRTTGLGGGQKLGGTELPRPGVKGNFEAFSPASQLTKGLKSEFE